MSEPWVATYFSHNAPAYHRWQAVLYAPRSDKAGATWQDRLPVVFLGQSEPEVTDKALAFWDAEVKREFGSHEARKTTLEKARAARAARKAKRDKTEAA